MIATIALLCGACCCAGGNSGVKATSQPAAIDQQAVGQIAAALAAQIQTSIATAVEAHGVEYSSELPWKTVAWWAGGITLAIVCMVLMYRLAIRRRVMKR